MEQKILEKIDQFHATAEELKNFSQKKWEEMETQGAATGQTIEEIKNRVEEVEKLSAALEKKAARIKAVKEENSNIEKEMKSVNDVLAAHGRIDQCFDDVEKFAEAKSLVEKALRKGDKSITPAEYKSLNGVIDPDGGYLVAPEINPALAKRVFENRQLVGAVTQSTIGTDTWKEYIDYAAYADSTYEDQLTDNAGDPGNNDMKEIVIRVGDQYYAKKFSRSVLEDSFVNLDTEVMGSVQKGMARKDADGVLTGLGTTESPLRGMLTYEAGTNWGQVQQITSSANDAFTWDDVLERLPAALYEDFHGNAQFCMRRQTFFRLLTAKDSDGKYQIGNQINFFDENLSMRLLGYGVLFDAGMPAVADGALAVMFGDFAEAYRKVNRLGFSVHRNETNPKFITLTGRNRVGGAVKQFQAYKILRIQ